MPKVLNRYKDKLTNGVYIGRPSKWGNPFVIGPDDGTRAEVISKYNQWLLSHPTIISQAKIELKGKDLICFCAPLPCHGDILLQVANAD